MPRYTQAEKNLRDAVARGEELKLCPDIDPCALSDGVAYPESCVVRAEVIVELLRTNDMPQNPVRLAGARISGSLRLEYGALRRALRLDRCWLDDIVVLADVLTPAVEFERSRLPALRVDAVDVRGVLAARKCCIGSVVLADSNISRSVSFERSCLAAAATPLRIRNVEIDGSLLLNNTRVCSKNEQAIHTDGLRIGHSMELSRARLVGGLVLDGAQISGRLDGPDLVVRNGDGSGISARHLSARGVVLERARITGGVDLLRARVSGGVLCSGAVISRPSGSALSADDIEAGRLHIDGARVYGGITMPRASVRGDVVLGGLRLSRPGGAALLATSAVVTGSLLAKDIDVNGQFICDEVRATSVELAGARVSCPNNRSALAFQTAVISGDFLANQISCEGTFNIKGIRVGGEVRLTGAVLDGGAQYALAASSCLVGGRLSVDEGADVRGGIDFAHTDVGKSLMLDWSTVRGVVRMFKASVHSDVTLRGTYIEDPGLALDAIGLQVDGRFSARGMTCDGGVRLTAMSADTVTFAGAQIHNPEGNAVTAARLDVRGNLELGKDPHTSDPSALRAFGGVVIRDSRVGGDLVFDNVEIVHHGRAVHATSIKVGGKLSLEGVEVQGAIELDRAHVRRNVVVKYAKFTGSGTETSDGVVALDFAQLETDEVLIDGGTIVGLVQLGGATVTEGVSLRGVTVKAHGGIAVEAPGLVTRELKLTDLEITGAIVMAGADVSGDLQVSGGHLRNPGNKVFDCSRIAIGGSLSFTGVDVHGFIALGHAAIGPSLKFESTKIVVGADDHKNTLVHAIDAAGITVAGDVECHGLRTDEQVSLGKAVVTGRVVFRGGSRLSAHHWPALYAPDVQVVGSLEFGPKDAARPTDVTIGGDVNLDHARLGDVEFHSAELAASGVGADPTVTLREAQVDGRIAMDALHIPKKMKAAINLSNVQAGGVELPQGNVAIDLRDAAVRTLKLDPSDTKTVQLSGLTFDEVSMPTKGDEPAKNDEPAAKAGALAAKGDELTKGTMDVRAALEWFTRDPDGYQHQAYEQLAAYYRRRGAEAAARKVMLERHRHQRRLLKARRPGQFIMKLWGFLQDLTVGYGYRPGLAAAWFAGLLAVGTVYFSLRAAPGPVEVNVHPTFNPFGYTLDLLIPLISFGQDLAWDPVGPDFLVAYSLIFAGGVLATTIAAAVTRVLARR